MQNLICSRHMSFVFNCCCEHAASSAICCERSHIWQFLKMGNHFQRIFLGYLIFQELSCTPNENLSQLAFKTVYTYIQSPIRRGPYFSHYILPRFLRAVAIAAFNINFLFYLICPMQWNKCKNIIPLFKNFSSFYQYPKYIIISHFSNFVFWSLLLRGFQP